VKRTIIAAFALAFATLGATSPNDSLLQHPAKIAERAPSRYDAAFKTTAGTFVIEVTRAWSPRGADRFYDLVKHGFYDGASFFRVVPGFVVQFGLTPNPAVNKAWSGATIPDDPVKESNRAGYVSFASAGPNTRTTQIFVNLGDNERLDSMGFSPFGKVVSGMSAVRAIYGGYAERPDQGAISARGDAYLKKSFPKLTRVLRASIVKP
jgi:peptidyl-prolyl cis-trans isomerase A (cyclophilin A)